MNQLPSEQPITIDALHLLFQQQSLRIAQLEQQVTHLTQTNLTLSQQIHNLNSSQTRFPDEHSEPDLQRLQQDENSPQTQDLIAWVEYLYLNLMRVTQHSNHSNSLVKAEFQHIEDWLYYVESQLSSQYDILVQLNHRNALATGAISTIGAGKSIVKPHFVSYHKYLQLREMFPDQYPPSVPSNAGAERLSTPPTNPPASTNLEDPNPLLDFPEPNTIFRTNQQQLDDELIIKKQHTLLLEQQRLHYEHDRKKNMQFQIISQRQKDLLVQHKLIQQPFSIRSGLTLQLQTSCAPDLAIMALQDEASEVVLMGSPNDNETTTEVALFDDQEEVTMFE